MQALKGRQKSRVAWRPSCAAMREHARMAASGHATQPLLKRTSLATKLTKVIPARRESNNVIKLVLTALRGLCGNYFFCPRRRVFNEAGMSQVSSALTFAQRGTY